ncbi:Lysophospholipase NTE1 [Seminavis robusta]|uniref:Lysophospholipase NTE1 n=1 Tax=Seminavis robusta TaxID=568900 RepID=A0A9N8HBL9_9STRA|nr:Lysophospholipase NTE1 [Seminavis robusta]|eukprot:Sro266_g103040.1 Lysophospholipase NTE1 (1421) ;mRNA; f:15834-20381
MRTANTCHSGANDDGTCISTTNPEDWVSLVGKVWLDYFWPSFAWQDILLVSFSTLFYSVLFLTVVYFWWANRQFHFRKRQKDGSRLSMVATKADALEYQRRLRAKAKDDTDDDSSESSSLTGDAAEDNINNTNSQDDADNNSIDNYSWGSFNDGDLSDYDTDDSDEEQETQQPPPSRSTSSIPKVPMKRRNSAFIKTFPPEKRQQVKDLTAVVSQMEVFSYLSQEAFVQCLEYMEYVDLAADEVLFDQETLDGSLYAVVSGRVKCQLEFVQPSQQSQKAPSQPKMHFANDNNNSNNLFMDDNDDDDDEEPCISFTAGNGDVVTSLLSMLAGLVRKCQERTNQQHNNQRHWLLPIVPEGISVRAVGAVPHTRLVKVPPHCFLGMLDSFPQDVHRIAQTIIARMQRVILQTVVRCLGLQKEIVRKSNNNKSSNKTNPLEKLHPVAWARLQTALQNYVPDAAPHTVQTQVAKDAAAVATALILGYCHEEEEEEETTTDQLAILKSTYDTIHSVGSVISLAPGHSLMEMGDTPDAIYIVLQGSLDVGMHVMGASSTLKQSQRRTSIMTNQQQQSQRRSIFPPAEGNNGEGGKNRRRSSIKRPFQQASNTTSSGTNISSQRFSRIDRNTVGEMAGQLNCFTGDPNIVSCRNTSEWEPALLYKIPKGTYESILATQPMALTECVGSILYRLGSPIVCLLDFNVEWMHVEAGEDVIQKGETCDALYAVLNGRLRAAVAPLYGHFNRKSSGGVSLGSSIPGPEVMDRNNSKETNKSFLARAKQRFKNKVIERFKKNAPQVANAPPRPSRRMMGEEAQGEEFGRGSIIGEVEILTGADWAQDIYASRHSELARVPVNVLNAIIRMCPRAGLHLARVVASQIQRKANASRKQQNPGIAPTLNKSSLGPPIQVIGDSPSKPKTATTPAGIVDSNNFMPSYGLPLATIAVVPMLEGDFSIDEFCQTLQNTLHTSIAPTKLMTKAFARQELGDAWKERNAMHKLKMTRLCGDMEENYRLVVYQAEHKYTWWTRFCIQRADCILLVVKAEKAPPKKQVEVCLSWAFAALNVKIQLVVLQSSSKVTFTDEDDEDWEAQGVYENMASSDELNDWSEQRYWIAGHHSVRTPFRKHAADFGRLCRRVTGRSIGIVLGGGGARGLAHIGVIKALMEAGITIDFVGGTSQGAYIGALYAMNPDDYPALVKAAKQMADSMANNWEKLRDLTLPLVSFFCGYRFNRGIQRSLGLRRIQDLVCNFFCVSVDIRNNVQVVHTKGVCWRYVRASMSLQSYLPPLSEDGVLLVDGGYMNVLPADVMKRQMKARTVIAVDVSAEVVLDNYEYGTHLNGWWLLYNSWNPFTQTVKIPSMGDISERLAWVNCDNQKKKVKEYIDLFLEPPVSNYGVLEYDKFDEIISIGYEHAKPKVDHFVKKYPHLVS